MYIRICWGNPREREHLEDLCVDGRIVLRMSEITRLTGCGLHCFGSELGQESGCYEDNSESSGVVKCWEFF